MKRLLQIASVAFAASMLVTYVVYSQLQYNQAVAPGSKGAIVRPATRPAASHTNPNTNVSARPSFVVFSGSKSLSSAAVVQAAKAASASNSSAALKPRPRMVAPGSKYMVVTPPGTKSATDQPWNPISAETAALLGMPSTNAARLSP